MDALVFTGAAVAAEPLPLPLAQPATRRMSDTPMIRQAKRDGVGITVQWGLSGEWRFLSARKARGVVGAAGAAVHGAAWVRAERTSPRHPPAVQARCNDALRSDTLLDPAVQRFHQIVLRVAD